MHSRRKLAKAALVIVSRSVRDARCTVVALSLMLKGSRGGSVGKHSLSTFSLHHTELH